MLNHWLKHWLPTHRWQLALTVTVLLIVMAMGRIIRLHAQSTDRGNTTDLPYSLYLPHITQNTNSRVHAEDRDLLYAPEVDQKIVEAPFVPAAAQRTLLPVSLRTLRGSTGNGQDLSGVNVAEYPDTNQSASWTQYLEISPTPDDRYTGYFDYLLPSDLDATTVTTLQLQTVYKGPNRRDFQWRWHVFDWQQQRWILLGDNRSAVAWQWAALTFSANGSLTDYVQSRTGRVRIRVQSEAGVGTMALDYQALSVTAGEGETPTAVPTATPTTSLSTCTLTPVMTFSPSPWASDSWVDITPQNGQSSTMVVAVQVKVTLPQDSNVEAQVYKNWTTVFSVKKSLPVDTWIEFLITGEVEPNDALQLRFTNPHQTFIAEVSLCEQTLMTPVTDTPTSTPTRTNTAVSPSTATPTVVPSGTPTATPTVTPTATPTVTATSIVDPMCNYIPNTNLQSAPPSDHCKSGSFGNWAEEINNSLTSYVTAECIELHNRFWTMGPDGQAYHTWHPTSYTSGGITCTFGHEHGDDPSNSPLFVEEQWPPFGYVLEQQFHGIDLSPHSHRADEVPYHPGSSNVAVLLHGSNGSPDVPAHRHEDHVGYKVYTTRYRAAVGNSAMGGATLYDAGFECEFLAVLHQGSHSHDAFANHLHEYHLAVECDDEPTDPTKFSLKLLRSFGEPERFQHDHPGRNADALPSSLETGSELTAAPLIGAAQITTSPGIDFRHFSEVRNFVWKSMETTSQSDLQYADLWAGIEDIKTTAVGNTSIKIGTYYSVRNPSRVYTCEEDAQERCIDNTGVVRRMATVCRERADLQGSSYCQLYNSLRNWDDPDSPFDGTFRGVSFKDFVLYNADGNAEFCTDIYGDDAETVGVSGDCPEGKILQRVATVNNQWENQSWVSQNGQEHWGSIRGSIGFYDSGGTFRCTAIPSVGTLESCTLVTLSTDNLSFIARGNGMDYFSDHRNAVGVHAPN